MRNITQHISAFFAEQGFEWLDALVIDKSKGIMRQASDQDFENNAIQVVVLKNAEGKRAEKAIMVADDPISMFLVFDKNKSKMEANLSFAWARYRSRTQEYKENVEENLRRINLAGRQDTMADIVRDQEVRDAIVHSVDNEKKIPNRRVYLPREKTND